MKIVFDLDGVLRNFMPGLIDRYGISVEKEWDWLHKGKDLFHWVKQDEYKNLIDAVRTNLAQALSKLT